MSTPSFALAALSIQNFRGIESLDLDFRGPDGLPNQLVVLAGPNGSGKTAVPEAALLAVGRSIDSKLVTGPSGARAIRRGSEGCYPRFASSPRPRIRGRARFPVDPASADARSLAGLVFFLLASTGAGRTRRSNSGQTRSSTREK